MDEPYRTKDGWVRAERLRDGEIEQRGWRHSDGCWHILRLRLTRKRPELWEVNHTIIPPPKSKRTGMANSVLFNTLTEARNHFRSVHKKPPPGYARPESA